MTQQFSTMSLEAITKALEAMEANLAECQGGRVGDAGDLVAALYRCADVDAPAVVAALRVAARIIAFVGEESDDEISAETCRARLKEIASLLEGSR